MNFDEFVKAVVEKVENHFSKSGMENVTVSIVPVTKHNDVILHGITVMEGEKGISPNIYLEPYFDRCEKGESIEIIAEDVLALYEETKGLVPEISDNDFTYEKIKDKVVYQIVDAKQNRRRLLDLKFSEAGSGFAKIYCIAVSKDASIPITNKMAAYYDYDSRKLFEDAERNTPLLHPATFTDINAAIFGSFMGNRKEAPLLSECEKINPDTLMYVLSNADGVNGAASIFYPDVKEKIAELIDDSYYVLPSSIHEVLILPCNRDVDAKTLTVMVKEINDTHVSAADRLSDTVMKYDKEQKELKIANDSVEKRRDESERGR